jgi:hypothetical protein
MNEQRRAAISNISSQLDGLISKLDGLMDQEQGYLENMPESFQFAEKGQKAERALFNLDTATANIQDAIDNLDSACK